MKRWQRILLEIFGPPGLAGAIVLVISAGLAVWDHWQRTGEFRLPMTQAGPWIASVFAASYIFALLPSVCYAGVMEWRFSRGLRPGSVAAIMWSSGLGGICGVIIIGAVSGGGDGWLLLVFGTVGLAVGAILGLIIRWKRRTGS